MTSALSLIKRWIGVPLLRCFQQCRGCARLHTTQPWHPWIQADQNTGSPDRLHTRRELLRGAARAAALAGLGGVAWLLGRRKGAARGNACVNDARCDYCGIFHRCDLKAAEDYRKALEGRHAG